MQKTVGINIKSRHTGNGFKQTVAGLDSVRKAQNRVQRSNPSFMKGMNANRRIVQQVGMQVSDLGVQIAGGQSALLSLTQNVPQVVQMFGAWGGILAAVITLMGTFTLVLYKSGKSFQDIMPYLGSAREEFEAIGRALNRLKEFTFDAINFIVNNLDTFFATLVALGAYAAGKFVASQLLAAGSVARFGVALTGAELRAKGYSIGMTMARGATVSFMATLRMMKKLLITTGIGALIVAAGVLVEKMLSLNEVTGSWGKSFSMVGEVIKQFATQVPNLFIAMHMKIMAVFAGFLSGVIKYITPVVPFIAKIIDRKLVLFYSMGKSVGAIFSSIKHNIIASFLLAFDLVRENTIKFINGIITMFNRIPGIEIKTIPLDFGKFGSDASREMKNIGVEAGSAFGKAMNSSFIDVDSISKMAASLGDRFADASGALHVISDSMFDTAMKNMPAWKELLETISLADAKATQFDIRDLLGKDGSGGISDKNKNAFTKSAEKIDDAIGKLFTKFEDRTKKTFETIQGFFNDISTDKFRSQVEEIQSHFDGIKERWEDFRTTVRDNLKETFTGVLNGTTSFKDGMLNLLDAIIQKILELVIIEPLLDSIMSKFSNFSSGGGILSGLWQGIGGGGFKLPFFNGGGRTPVAPRAGGLDGKGGFLAMLHPNEYINDNSKMPANENAFRHTEVARKSVTIINKNYFNGVTREEVMEDVKQSQNQLKKDIKDEFPDMIDNHDFNRRRGVM